MRPFAYCAPTSLAEAVGLLTEGGERARPFAGGTDLLVQMRLGLFAPDLLVDVKRIPELNEIAFNPEEGLNVGAAVPLWRVCEHPDITAAYPGLLDAAALIGGAAIQGRATLGGNLCNAAPSGDSLPAMIALSGRCLIAGPQGRRSVPVELFCRGPRKTVLGMGELLVAIHFPPPQPHSGARYLRFIPRNEMDIAVAGVGAWVALSADLGRVSAARIALGAVGPTPILAGAAGESLVGQAPTEEALAAAAALAQEAARPISDVRGTAAQRRHLVGVLARRALCGAVARAKGKVVHER